MNKEDIVYTTENYSNIKKKEIVIFLLPPSIFPSIRVFSNESALWPSGGQSIGVSASASVLPMNSLGWTDFL